MYSPKKYFMNTLKEFGKLLARALQSKETFATIHSLSDSQGNKVTSNNDIANHFIHFSFNFTTSWSPIQKNSPRLQSIKDFFHEYSPKALTVSEAKDLKLLISAEEATTALKQMKTGKSPGPDGFTVSNYKSFTDTLLPHFLKAFNSLSS